MGETLRVVTGTHPTFTQVADGGVGGGRRIRYDRRLRALHEEHYVVGSGEVVGELFSVTDDSKLGRPVSDHYPIAYTFEVRAR